VWSPARSQGDLRPLSEERSPGNVFWLGYSIERYAIKKPFGEFGVVEAIPGEP